MVANAKAGREVPRAEKGPRRGSSDGGTLYRIGAWDGPPAWRPESGLKPPRAYRTRSPPKQAPQKQVMAE